MYNDVCTWWGVCASILAWNNWWNISRSVVVDDAHYVGDCTHWKHGVNTRTCKQWIHEHACTENMWTINGTSVDRLSKTMLRYWYLQGLKTWSEYMSMHAVNTCKQSINYTCTCVLQFITKNNENIECNSMCTWWWVCACILAWKQFMETIHGTSVDRLSKTMHRCWWLYALKTWSEYMNKDAVNTCKRWWKYTCIIMCTTILNKNNDNIVCNSMCTWWWVCAWILAWKQFMETLNGTTVVRLS